MKSIILIILTLNLCLVSCNKNNHTTWKPKYSDFDLELVFNDKWELSKPIDNDDMVLVMLSDSTDYSSFSVKIEPDFSKDLISDKDYFEGIKIHFLDLPENQLIKEDYTNFQGIEYKRLIFLMKRDFGEMTHTIYTYRNEKKVININFSYPKNLIEKPTEKIPLKIEELLNRMKI